MSHTSSFHSLLLLQPSGRFSKGLRILMSASNLEFMQRDAVDLPFEPMAHVLLHQENTVRMQVFRVFAQDAIDCPPPVVKAAVVDLPVPVAAGLVAGILPVRLSNLDLCDEWLVCERVQVVA